MIQFLILSFDFFIILFFFSCLDSFTGDQCETDVITTTQPTTQAPTQTPDGKRSHLCISHFIILF